jgi:hypothetical protein
MYVAAVLAVAGMLTYRLLRGNGLRPKWAWLAEHGDEGAARLAIGTAAVVGAAILVGVLVLTSSSTPSAAATTDAQLRADEQPIADSAPSQADRQREEEQERPAAQQQTANVQFSGTASGDGWRLVSPSLRGTELDLGASGQFALIRSDTGETIFKASQPVDVNGQQGQLQTVLSGVGSFAGRQLSIDGTYVVSGSQVLLTAGVVLDAGATR